MKKLFGLIMISMMLLTTLGFAATTFIDSSLIKVDLAKYTPYPAEGGKFVTVYITASNAGNQPVKNIIFILEPKYPFTLPDNDSYRNYASITGLDSVNLEYRLLVDKNAPNSTSEIVLKYYTSDNIMQEKKMIITVIEGEKDKTAALKALLVDAKPTPYPYGTTKLTVDVANTGDGTAYHTIVAAESGIASIKRSEVFVGNLAPDEFDSVDFEMRFLNATKGEYPINITMIYKDADGKEFAESSQVYVTLITAQEAALLNRTETSIWMIIIYIIVILIVLRAILYPFVKWFIKPFRKKKKSVE